MARLLPASPATSIRDPSSFACTWIWWSCGNSGYLGEYWKGEGSPSSPSAAFGLILHGTRPDCRIRGRSSRFFALVTRTYAKFALDVNLLMQTGVVEVSEPYAPHRGFNSTMPQTEIQFRVWTEVNGVAYGLQVYNSKWKRCWRPQERDAPITDEYAATALLRITLMMKGCNLWRYWWSMCAWLESFAIVFPDRLHSTAWWSYLKLEEVRPTRNIYFPRLNSILGNSSSTPYMEVNRRSRQGICETEGRWNEANHRRCPWTRWAGQRAREGSRESVEDTLCCSWPHQRRQRPWPFRSPR